MSYVTRAVLITAISVSIWLFLVRFVTETGDALEACTVSYVYDGDTVALRCEGADTEVTARLVGLDAPEVKEPKCEAELAHGALATDRLRALVDTGEVSLFGLGQDRYERELIRLEIDGEDVADRLVREGLAVAYEGGARIDWCARLGDAESSES